MFQANDFMAYVRLGISLSICFSHAYPSKINLIYLAILSERIPIIPPPSFSHHVEGHDIVFFHQVFDIDAFSESLQWPILDWSEVKAPESKQWDALGCWFTWYGPFL